MATILLHTSQRCMKIPTSILCTIQRCIQQSSFLKKNFDNKDCVVITEDASTIICWHPEPRFPYEYSRPLPESPKGSDSVLNMNSSDAYRVFRHKSDEIVRQELMKLTFTTKHRWFPRSRDKYARRNEPDRKYL